MDTNYTSKLDEIVTARKSAFKPTPLLVAIIAIGIAANYFVSGAAAIFGVAAFLVFYQRLVAVAHMPCPKCGKPFGTTSNISLGVGTDNCQNCGLSLYE